MTDHTTQAHVNVYIVGHGRHAWADFLALLRLYEIESGNTLPGAVGRFCAAIFFVDGGVRY